MKKLRRKLTKEESYWWRFVNIIVLASIITICVIYFFVHLTHLGDFGKYFAGAIAGGLWSYIWYFYLESPGKKWHTLSTLQYIIILIISIGILLYIWWAVNFLIN